jgi:hypothetical protein
MKRFTDRDHFMRQRGGGVGHLSTRHCNEVLLQDQHTLLHDNENASTPENVDKEVTISYDSDEGDIEEDEGAADILEHEGDLGDEDLIAGAGFSIL